jgi:N,N'-diacetyllegionaminate synthase
MSNGNARAEIIAELATAHGGDIDIAMDMIDAAADAGASTVKTQAYDRDKINPKDHQADWLRESWLSPEAHQVLMGKAKARGLSYLSTPFDRDSQRMLYELGLRRFKIASSEAHRGWWRWGGLFLVSWPWGQKAEVHAQCFTSHQDTAFWAIEYNLTAIPLYPTPLEAVNRAPLLDGYSDHTEGIDACLYALARGAKVVEVHLCLPGRSRVKSFDKDPAQLRQIRKFSESVATITSGVGQTFRERWNGNRQTA